MKAAHVVAHRQIKVFEVEAPKIEDFPVGSIKVKTRMTAICGSDSPHFVLKRQAEDYPLNIGISIHECVCLLYTSPSPRDRSLSRMPSSA